MPSIPGTEQIDLIVLGDPLVRVAGALQLLGQQLDLFLQARLSVHGHVNDDVYPRRNMEHLLDSPCILGDGLAISILPGTRDEDTPDSAEVGIGDLQVKSLAGEASNDRVRRAEIDPWARVGQHVQDVRGGKEARILVGECGHSRARKGWVGLLGIRQA